MTRYLEQLNETTDPVTGDFLPIYDASAGATDKDRKVNISRFAILATAGTFTTTQTIAPATTSAHGLIVNSPTSTTGYGLVMEYNGSVRQYSNTNATLNQYVLTDFDNGANAGPHVYLGRNTNGTSYSAGFLYMTDRLGTLRSLWFDNAGIVRIGALVPTSGNDNAGTVLGTQTSMAEAKNISDVLPDPRESLRNIMAAAKQLRAFNYKSSAYNGEEFPCGIVTDLSPRYGLDRDEAHPHGKSLNTIVAIGDLMASVALIAQRLGVALME